ncbi:Tim44 domain-containing protein [Candidatus Vallotia lariciata]|uniref:Tim44 domain-containing protein n=1 Tax=Candidatus Vallotia laricis TaxID=2018052 RepID=UPI001D032EED|nr:TIM44-like domain-containing protein [Candidatus Vallotia lariciata]UDG83304.1 hypothetical protein GKR41_00700 [Candidatus Vallotia lariciata]
MLAYSNSRSNFFYFLTSITRLFSALISPRLGAIAVASLLAIGLFSACSAEAKRIGSGRSIGRQSHIEQQAQPSIQLNTPAQSAQASPHAQTLHSLAPPPKRDWLSPLAGLAAGFGLAALLSQSGFGGGLVSVLTNSVLIVLVAFAGLWLFRKFSNRNARSTPAYAHSTFNLASDESLDQYKTPVQFSMTEGMNQASIKPNSGVYAAAGSSSILNISIMPTDFNVDAFIREAKAGFLRLQAAWDTGNLSDIREFTTTEMFSEIKRDLYARNGENRTDIVQLKADLIGVENCGNNEFTASVRFCSLLREVQGGTTEQVSEIWNFSQNLHSSKNWVLAGIQQLPDCNRA